VPLQELSYCHKYVFLDSICGTHVAGAGIRSNFRSGTDARLPPAAGGTGIEANAAERTAGHA